MNTAIFINYLESFTPLSIIAKNDLQTRIRVQETYKGQLLLYPGDLCKSVYFVTAGFYRVFKLTHETEFTLNFVAKNSLLTVLNNFTQQKSNSEGIICEAEGCLLQLNHSDLMDLHHLYPEFIKLQFLITQAYLLQLHQENLLLRNANAAQKYLHLTKKYPGIAHLTSYKNIASYLGITQPTLSNLIKDL